MQDGSQGKNGVRHATLSKEDEIDECIIVTDADDEGGDREEVEDRFYSGIETSGLAFENNQHKVVSDSVKQSKIRMSPSRQQQMRGVIEAIGDRLSSSTNSLTQLQLIERQLR